MKELTIKKETPDVVRQMVADGQVSQEVAEKYFPEFRESESERIRKALKEYFINSFQNNGVASICGVHIIDILTWLEKQGETYTKRDVDDAWLKGMCDAKRELEKQGEQKSIINVPPRDVILSIWDLGNEWKELTNGSISTEYGTQLDYIQKHWRESEYYLKEKRCEQKPIIEMKSPEESLGISSKEYNEIVNECLYGEQKPADRVEPKFKVGEIGYENVNIYPATKEQRDFLFKKMKEAGYEWDADKKELNKIEQKPSWSEEDENRMKKVMHILSLDGRINNAELVNIYDWLKSLRPQNNWKPSDEQIEALDSATENCAYSEYQDCLRELIGQLKKLREE